MKIKIQVNFNGEITEEEITPIYRCHHVNDRKYYPKVFWDSSKGTYRKPKERGV